MPTLEAQAAATRIMIQLTGRRWTWPRRRVIEQYHVPETVSVVNLVGRPVSGVNSVVDRQGNHYQFTLSDAGRLWFPQLAHGAGLFPWPTYDSQGGYYPNQRWHGTELTIDYVYGNPPPQDVQKAIDEFATQLDLIGTADCLLPSRVTSVTREGVSWTVLDPMQFLEGGKTGLYYPDLVISAYNGTGRVRARAKVYSPEFRPPHRLFSEIVDPNDTGGITPIPPGSSGYPDITNSGIPAGKVLVPHIGDFTTTSPNQIVELLDMTSGGSIIINHPGCEVRFNKLANWAVAGIYTDTGALSGTPAQIHHNEVGIPTNPTSSTAMWGAQGFANAEAHHNNIFGAANGYDVSNGNLHDEYIHDLSNTGLDPHSDGIQTTTGVAIHDLTINHCTILAYGDGALANSAIIFAVGSISFTNITVNNTVMAGGGYTLIGPASGATGVVISVNLFWTLYNPLVGQFGPLSFIGGQQTLTGNLKGTFSGGYVSQAIIGTFSGTAIP